MKIYSVHFSTMSSCLTVLDIPALSINSPLDPTPLTYVPFYDSIPIFTWAVFQTISDLILTFGLDYIFKFYFLMKMYFKVKNEIKIIVIWI